MKQNFTVTLLTSIAVLICFYAFSSFIKPLEKDAEPLKVGFIYDSDASTPYSYNFIRAQKEAEYLFGDRIQTFVKNNVSESDCEGAIQELIDEKCGLIITYADNCFLPFNLLAARTLRPPLVLMRARKPCTLALDLFFG